jgi:hypothetical protein
VEAVRSGTKPATFLLENVKKAPWRPAVNVQACLSPVAYDLTIDALEGNLPIEATSDKGGSRASNCASHRSSEVR